VLNLTDFSNFTPHDKGNLKSCQLNFLSPYFMGRQFQNPERIEYE